MKSGAISGGSHSVALPEQPRLPHSGALRVGGVLLAYGYLIGLVPGSIVTIAGALAVLTAGRSLLLDGGEGLIASASFVVLVSAVGVAAFRWGTMSLEDLRGIQAVLGATLEVGPTQMATGAGLAATGGFLALSNWLVAPAPSSRLGWFAAVFEAGAGAVAIVTAFWGASLIEGSEASDMALVLGRWIGLSVLLAGLALSLAHLLRRASRLIRSLTLGLAAVLTAVGLGLVAGGL